MIGPEEIRKKAENLFPAVLCAWLDGDDAFFPRLIPSNRDLDASNPTSAARQIQRLREESKEERGFGYSVEWQTRRSRDFGLNSFPKRIVFETRDDFLRFLRRQSEFSVFASAVSRLRAEFPELNKWSRSHRQLLIDAASDLDGLLEVLHFFVKNPRPCQFARELPLSVDTKFIERHERILGQWFDLVLPPHSIHSGEERFDRRFGLRAADPHTIVRLLDPSLRQELGFPCDEFSVPVETLGRLPARSVLVMIVENKVNLLTLPLRTRTIGLGALGRAVTDLRAVAWLADVPIIYWGDIDVEGYEILSSLRAIFPRTVSLLMDSDTLSAWENLVGPGMARRADVPLHLTESESQAFVRCRDFNLRLEQERIPPPAVAAALQLLSATGGPTA